MTTGSPSPKELARSQLPNFPEEIFVLWMDKLIDRSSWPPKRLEDDCPKDCWEKLLLCRSLSYWRSRSWEKKVVYFDSYVFQEMDWRRISDIIGANICGLDNPISRQIYNTKERFERIRSYVEANLKFPQPPIFLQVSDEKYELMDGHHRLAVFFYLFTKTEFKRKLDLFCEAWIAT